MAYDCWYECIHDRNERYSIFDVIYRCRDCDGLLEVEHDIEALKVHTAEEWKQLFDQRTHSRQFPYGSGVWGKKEWVAPMVRDENIISMYEGNTNLFNAHHLGQQLGLPDLWVKLCGNSHTGSFKDLGMTVLVSVVKQMISEGKPIRAVACASTGDTSAALAAYAAAAGIPAVILLPRAKVSPAQLIQPIANGATVLSLDTDFDGCMKIVPDWIVLPAGNLGNVSALGKGLLMMQALGLIDRLPRIACAQAANANPLYLSFKQDYREFQPVKAQKTLASAIQIGNPVSYDRAVRILKAFDGVVEEVTEDELANAAARADRTGLYCCPHTGVALGAVIKLLEKGTIKKDERVVVISTAHGLKFSEFKVQYHQEQLEDVASRFANPPVELPANFDAVIESINKLGLS